MKNLLFILLLAATLFLAIFFFWKFKTTQTELALASQRILDRDTQLFKTQKEVASLKQKVTGKAAEGSMYDTIQMATPPSARFIDELGSLSGADVSRLQKKGLQNPEVDLQNDLIKHPDLIPVKGTAGGTMAFRDIRILNDRYALAYFEDGHKGGNMLLKYSVQNGEVTWKVLDSYSL